VTTEGGSKAAMADASAIGGLTGVTFKWDSKNRFNVMSKEGMRGLKEEVGMILSKGESGGSGSGC
jgi:hypothetical protein